jgi:hypothetical protein
LYTTHGGQTRRIHTCGFPQVACGILTASALGFYNSDLHLTKEPPEGGTTTYAIRSTGYRISLLSGYIPHRYVHILYRSYTASYMYELIRSASISDDTPKPIFLETPWETKSELPGWNLLTRCGRLQMISHLMSLRDAILSLDRVPHTVCR